MKKLDLLLGLILVAICGVFYFMISRLPSKATLYPIFVTTLLLFLTIIHLIITYNKKDNAESTVFKDIELKQLLFVLGSSGLYVAMINIIGYITSTIIYILVVLLGLKVRKETSVVISIVFAGLIYILFKVLLRVPLPRGFII